MITTNHRPVPMSFGAPTIGLTNELRAAMLDHAEHRAPEECCGLLFRVDGVLTYAPGENISPTPKEHFRLDPQTWALCEDHGEIVAVVHSHPEASANPSHADGVGCEASGLPWLIVGWPSSLIVQLQPSGWRAPLVGREFCFGVLDCWALVRDYYAWELAIALPDFEREDGFWKAAEGRPVQHPIRDHMAEAGFSFIEGEPQPGDVLVMRYRSMDVDNHLAIYLGEGRILHTLAGRLSEVEMWGEALQRRTQGIGRHVEMARRLQQVADAAAEMTP